jgi:hypothetical protein
MIIHSGRFNQPISTIFSKLYSLKMFVKTRTSIPKMIITNCPQLVQLSLTNRASGSENIITKLLTKILPSYDLTLQNLQLVKDPIQFSSSNRLQWFKEFGKEAIGALAFYKNLKFLEISGFLYVSEQDARVLDKGHPELEAVMLNYAKIDEYKKKLKVYVRARDSRIICWLVNQMLISNAEPFEVSSHT